MQFRPQLEALEDRCVPAAVSWTGAISDNWHRGDNWSGSEIPNGDDEVTIDTGGTGNQPYMTGNGSVAELIINAGSILTISAGSTLTMGSPATVYGRLNLGTSSNSGIIVGNVNVSGSSATIYCGVNAYIDGTLTIGTNANLYFASQTSYLTVTTLTTTTTTSYINMTAITGGAGNYISCSDVNLAGPLIVNIADDVESTWELVTYSGTKTGAWDSVTITGYYTGVTYGWVGPSSSFAVTRDI